MASNEDILANFEGQAHDMDGNEVFPVIINTICPVQYSVIGKQVSADYFINIEKSFENVTTDKMLNDNLGPIGSDQITHIFCSRFGYTHQAAMEVQQLIDLGESFMGKKEYTLDDDPDEIKSLFCCIIGDKDELLSYLGLEIKSID